MNLTDLISAVASYISECGGATTKTKLLKLLYLLDIEAYRQTGQTLTGFDWIFHRFGPWAASYDDALADAAQANRVKIAAREFDEGATFINSVEKVPISQVFTNIVQELTAKRIIEAWATKPTVELLDYVYFHTAPMRDAERHAALDFSTVLTEPKLAHYKGLKSDTDPREAARKRRQFLETLNSRQQIQIVPLDPPPNYDDNYWSSIAQLESDMD
jgi:hypothetical protein